MSSARLPAIPTPDAENLLVSVQALKQAVEMLSGQVGGTGPGSVLFDLVSKAAASGATPTTGGGGGGGGLGGLITDINSLTTLINTLVGQARQEFNNAIAIAQQAAGEAVADLNVAFGELNDLIASQGVTITSLQSQTNNNAAGITDEIAARTTADTALSGRITTLNATVDGNNANITGQLVVLTNADTALSGRLDTLTATVAGNTAAITAEQVARTNEDSSLAATLTNVSAVASKQRVFSQPTAPSSTGRTVGDIWIDTANGNLIKYWDGSQWLARDDARVAVNTADITTQRTALTTLENSIATSIAQLTSRVDGNEARIINEEGTRATRDSAISGDVTSLTARVSNNESAIRDEKIARTTKDDSLAADITAVSARTNAGTADGKMQLVAVSLNNGVVATEFSVKVSATGGATGSYANTGLTLQAMSNGTSRVLFNADSFLIASGNSTHVPFAIVDTSLVPQFNVGPGQIKLGDPSNCLLNGSFDNASLSGWVPGSTTRIDVAGPNDPGGKNRLRSLDRNAALSNIVTARGGQEFYLSAMVWNAAPERANLCLRATDAAGANEQDFVAAYTDLRFQWVLLEGVCKLPADTKVQQVQVLLRTDSTGARPAEPVGAEPYTYWGKVSLRRAITSNMLTAGIGANIIYNSTFNSGLDGWVSGYNNTGLSAGFGKDYGAYTLNGSHTLYATLSGVQPTNSIFDCYNYVIDNSTPKRYPVRSGDRVQFYAYLNTHRCTGHIGIVFFDADNNLINQVNSNLVPSFVPPDGKTLDKYKLAKLICDAPANAATAFLFFRMLGTGEENPYLFWTRPFFGPAGPAQIDVSPWSTGIEPQFGPGNLITSSNISTYIANAAIDLARINVASINYLSAFSANIGEVTAGVVRSADNKVRFDLSNSYMLISD